MKNLITIYFLIAITGLYAQEESPKEIRAEKAVQDIGDYTQHLPAAAALVLILTKKDKKGFWQFAKSYGTTLTASYILKYAINKPRPDGATDGHAFPSGHTAAAFSGASFIHRRYGWKYGIPAYLVATYVGYSRVEGLNDRHDGWDVLAGAVVGIGSTYIFTTPYQREHYELSFKGSSSEYLLGINFKF